MRRPVSPVPDPRPLTDQVHRRQRLRQFGVDQRRLNCRGYGPPLPWSGRCKATVGQPTKPSPPRTAMVSWFSPFCPLPWLPLIHCRCDGCRTEVLPMLPGSAGQSHTLANPAARLRAGSRFREDGGHADQAVLRRHGTAIPLAVGRADRAARRAGPPAAADRRDAISRSHGRCGAPATCWCRIWTARSTATNRRSCSGSWISAGFATGVSRTARAAGRPPSSGSA